jgi:periplasmic protein TonB
MLPRIVVPTNARLDSEHKAPEQLSGTQQAHLVPRRLIPANARLNLRPYPEGTSSDRTSLKRRPLVGKLLVPAGARVGENLSPNGAGGRPAAQHLFDEALLTKPALGRRRTAADWLISVAVHAAIIAAVVMIPLFFTQAINPQQLELTYLVAPPLPRAPAPPPPPAAAIAPRQVPKPITPVLAKLTMPIAIPKVISKPTDTEVAEAAPDITGGVAGGVPGGVPGGELGGVLGGIANGVTGGAGFAPPPPPPPTPAPTGPLQVGGEVKPPHLLFAPQPEYPVLAKQARIQGIVQIDAVIDQSGNVVQEKAVSGSGVLIAAALDAVKQWKYEPTYLNGKPYPVELAVNVTFRL